MKNKQKINSIIKVIIFSIFTILLFVSIFIYNNSKNITFEQLLYSVFYSKGTSISAIIPGLKYVLLNTFGIFLIIVILKIILNKIIQKTTKKNKIIIIFVRKKHLILNVILLMYCIFVLLTSAKCIRLDEYIKSGLYSSKIYEKYFVEGDKIDYTFPQEKRNLIYIFVESLEMTNAVIENGGKMITSYIPNLEELALNNINFSNSSLLGGAKPMYGTGWTMAALISQTSGLPLRVSIDSYDYEQYTESLPGAYSLGDVLKDNGYSNYFMLGSDSNFANRKEYFINHGKYEIYDYIYAKEQGWIEDDYYEWWGYEDKKLYEFAKKELIRISKEEKPFNFTMLTADTHFPDGYIDDTCSKKSDIAYINSLICTDNMLSDFVSWLKKQDFFENTTIIITGDHLSMQPVFYDEKEERTIYNVIINSAIESENYKNREFTSFDMYPTTLAALGVKIEGDKIGFGTNLFSSEQTLIEKIGDEYFNEELKKKSLYYENFILKN